VREKWPLARLRKLKLTLRKGGILHCVQDDRQGIEDDRQEVQQ